MATTYRKATEKDIKKGKGKSTDELSFDEAKAYFNKRAKETGMDKFRYQGKVYDLSGKESASTKAAPKAASTKAAPKAASTKAAPKAASAAKPAEGGKGGGGADKMPATGVTAPKKYSGRGDGASEASRRSKDAKAESARKAREDMSDKAKKVAVGGAALGAAVALARAGLKSGEKAPRKVATPTITNPKYGSNSKMAEGFQGKYETGVGRPGMDARRGLAGNAAPFERVAGGGGRASMENKDDKLPMFNKGGMVKKGKK